MKKFKLDHGLQPYANPHQWTLLLEWEKHGTCKKAAKACNRAASSCYSNTWSIVRKNAALRGYAPDHPEVFETLPGLVLKGTSTLRDGHGGISSTWNKTKQEGRPEEETVQLPDPKTITKVSTLYDQEGNVTQQWVATKPEAVAQVNMWEEFAKALAEEMPRVEPTPPPVSLRREDLMTLYPVGDHHLGMLSWVDETGQNYDMKIGENLLKKASDYLLRSAPHSDRCTIIFLGDFLHYDSFEPVTPISRNQLDADSRYPKMVRAGIRCMRYMIERALTKHGLVNVIVEIGNHDLSSSVFLMECLHNIYENEPRVNVDNSPKHYHYFQFGKNLVGTHHGHGTKMSQLPITMANDVPEMWATTLFRYFLTGHIHKRLSQSALTAEDYSGVSVESFRVMAPVDAWGHQKGYRPIQDMKSIILHADHGEVARHTVNAGMIGG